MTDKELRRYASTADLPMSIHSLPSAEALPLIAEASGGKCLVAFSMGKDSVAMVLHLRKHFSELALVYRYRGRRPLRIQQESMAYFEKEWDTRIICVPHPTTWKLLDAHCFQRPQGVRALEKFDMPGDVDVDDLNEFILEDLQWPADVPVALGTRMADSIFRRIAIRTHGAFSRKHNAVYPIFDWNSEDIVRALRETGTKLPADYWLFGRSLDGFDVRFMEPLAESYPDDYEALCELFPMLHANTMRYVFARRRRDAEKRRFRGGKNKWR